MLSVLVLGTALAVGYPVLTGARDEANTSASTFAIAPSQEAAPMGSDPFAEPQVCAPEEQVAPLAASACGRCPPEQPRCYRARDCDSVCGGKGTGVCEWINSCFKCCTCAGTT